MQPDADSPMSDNRKRRLSLNRHRDNDEIPGKGKLHISFAEDETECVLRVQQDIVSLDPDEDRDQWRK